MAIEICKKFLMEENALVLQTSNVDFQIEPKKRNQGIFSLYIYENSNYYIEWIPDPKRDQEMLKKRNIPPKVTVTFQQLTRIERVNDSFNRTALSFTLEDSSRLPLFIFNNFAYLFVSHFLEFLIFKNIIRVSAKYPMVYHVLKKDSPFPALSPYSSASTDLNQLMTDEKPDLTPEEIVSIHTHNQILTNLGYKAPLTSKQKLQHQIRNTQLSVTISDLTFIDFSEIKKMIFQNGIAPESRPFIWPMLFGVLPYSKDTNLIKNHLRKITDEYLNIITQYEQFTDEQKTSSAFVLDTQRIITNDVRRNDRQEDAFKSDDSPNLLLLKNVLLAYAVFNRDTGYVQGMNDLVSPLILIFIKEWDQDGKALFHDGTLKTREEAEAFIFWSFVGMMELTQQERLFTDLAKHQEFVLKRIAKIATTVHQPLQNLLKQSAELNTLSFLFKPVILLFKRAFKQLDLYRLWDSLFTADSPSCFSRFVAAAALILLFPKLLIHTNQTLGEVMSFADLFIGEVEITSVINLASILMKQMPRGSPLYDFVNEPVPDRDDYRHYTPKYFKPK